MSSSNSTVSPTKPKVLLAGLNVHSKIPAYFRELYGTPEQIKAEIDADTARVRGAGYNLTVYFVDDTDPQSGLDWLEHKLKEEKFDGILVGSGVKLIPEQTALFESIVGVCVKACAREGRVDDGMVLMFNYGPGTNFETLQRNQGRLKRRMARTGKDGV
ncbi:hypothetical protein BKA66DRAFT_283307 [Pyrenochaeta sp. MPI-SDFR-AT-0127]|nr:hypothetical protein BKA66DRAFT_283307 [Pyrenochaeta sp. MPI-SDFR-AT-0127]